jgi:2-polyprenyl-6-methoxyphenol hydroxylase-like FAD-dependent oxidoreductase
MKIDRGQALNHGITDVAKLFEAIKDIKDDKGLKQAIDAYEEEMIPRTKLETDLSVQNTYMTHDWAKMMESPIFKQGIAKSS